MLFPGGSEECIHTRHTLALPRTPVDLSLSGGGSVPHVGTELPSLKVLTL